MKALKHFNSYINRFRLLTVFVIFWGCQEKPLVVFKNADHVPYKIKNEWLAKDEHFNKSEYKETFQKYFEDGVSSQNYLQASDALLAVFEVMSNRGYFEDTFYYSVLKDYVKKYPEEILKEHLFTFHVYLGVFETFNGRFEEAIQTLKNIEKWEPDSYTTFSDIGYAYYYISCNYYYLGDYLKSLEELKKATDYFNHTDNLSGQAQVEVWRANLHFTTKNKEDALITIDKALEIYGELDDPVGEATVMLTKYGYLIHDNYELADQYLNTIDQFIQDHDIQYIHVLLHHNQVKVKKYLTEKNIEALEILIPVFEKQVKKANIDNYNKLLLSAQERFRLLKNKKILNKSELIALMENYIQNNEFIFAVDIMKMLKDEAVLYNDLKQVLAYQEEIEKLDKKIAEEELQFKVKIFEKRIQAEEQQKTIAQQQVKLSQSNILILGLVLSLTIVLFVTILIMVRRRKKEAQLQTKMQEQFTFQLLQNTEEERSRIAGELHDSVNQDLLTMKHNVLNGNQMVADDFTKVIEEVRNISRNLHPSILENLGLKASIEHLCEKLTDVGLFTTCEVEYENQLSKNKELQIYRIIQEALNNTLKHGKANAAKVILTINDHFLHLEIKDNGNGFDVDKQLKNPKSFGLQSILQRAKAIAAKININSNNKGTVILIKIPF